MPTKAELNRKIEDLEKLMEANNKELYSKHNIQGLKDQLEEARSKYYNDVDAANKLLQDEIDSLYNEIAKINNLVVPESIEKFVNSMFSGTTWYGQWEVKWFSPDERYVYGVLKGRTEWDGIGSTKYYPTKHHMWDRLAKVDHLISRRSYFLFEHEGRLPANTLKEWKETVLNKE